MNDPVHGNSAERFGGWYWRESHYGEHWMTCSYCGSIHPEDLVAELPASSLHWADLKYGWPHKLYIDIPSRDPGKIFPIGLSNTQQSYGHPWKAIADLTNEECEILNENHRDLTDVTYVLFSTRETLHTKFYSVHLLDPQLDASTKSAIEAACGVHFETMDDDMIKWQSLKSMN